MRFTFSILLILLITESVLGTVERFRCMFGDDPAYSMIIGWDQVSGSDPVLYYDINDWGGEWKNYANKITPGVSNYARGMNNKFARIEGLLPETVYYFIILDSDGMSERLSFKTLPDHPHSRLSIIAGGDSRNNREARQNANMLVSKLKPHFVMFDGDMTGSDNSSQWIAWFNDWQLTITSERQLIPIIPARGNHESSNQTLVDLFNIPSSDAFYSISLGGDLMRVYTLNSMIAAGGKQLTWLEQELAGNSDVTWQVAQYHRPIKPHTRGKSDQDMAWLYWAPLFFEHGVDLVVEGDAHVCKTTWPVRPSSDPGNDEGFVRDDVNGTVYIGEGCWGAPLRPNNDDKEWTRASESFNQFKWIFVDLEKIEIRTVKTDNAPQVGEVYVADIFFEPYNLDIWNAPNGKVVTIINDKFVLTPPPAPTPVFVEFKMPSELKTFVLTLDEPCVVNIEIPMSTSNQDFSLELERSTNGVYFTVVHTWTDKELGDEKVLKFTDKQAFFLNSDEMFYRLKINPTNGQDTLFSNEVSINLPAWDNYSILETSASSKLVRVNYDVATHQDVKMLIYNSLGLEILQKEYKDQKKGSYMRVLNLKTWSPGTYLMHLTTDAGDFFKRILVTSP